MLKDPRSDALVTNFAQQLLYLRNLPATSPDGIYLELGRRAAAGFQARVELFFESISARTATSSIC